MSAGNIYFPVFSFVWKYLCFVFVLKTKFTGYRILGWQFCLKHFKYIFSLSSAPYFLCNIIYQVWFCSFKGNILFISVVFKIFFVSDFQTFSSFGFLAIYLPWDFFLLLLYFFRPCTAIGWAFPSQAFILRLCSYHKTVKGIFPFILSSTEFLRVVFYSLVFLE